MGRYCCKHKKPAATAKPASNQTPSGSRPTPTPKGK